ncbi:MAG TPA: response regulator [Thioploca sp.]|nr:response regulator [Thioploca sp.]
MAEAVNGREALDKTTKWQPYLMLLDLIMPDINGFEIIRQIRQTPDLKDMIVIVVSATAFPKTRQEILAAGCDDFIAKPLQLNTLLQSLQTFLALEWIYEETAETQSQLTDDETLPLIMPAREELVALLELAEIGCITGIQETFIDKEHEPQINILAGVQTLVWKKEPRQTLDSLKLQVFESNFCRVGNVFWLPALSLKGLHVFESNFCRVGNVFLLPTI